MLHFKSAGLGTFTGLRPVKRVYFFGVVPYTIHNQTKLKYSPDIKDCEELFPGLCQGWLPDSSLQQLITLSVSFYWWNIIATHCSCPTLSDVLQTAVRLCPCNNWSNGVIHWSWGEEGRYLKAMKIILVPVEGGAGGRQQWMGTCQQDKESHTFLQQIYWWTFHKWNIKQH